MRMQPLIIAIAVIMATMLVSSSSVDAQQQRTSTTRNYLSGFQLNPFQAPLAPNSNNGSWSNGYRSNGYRSNANQQGNWRWQHNGRADFHHGPSSRQGRR